MMNLRPKMAATSALVLAGIFACAALAQDGVVEKVGEKIDGLGRGIRREASVAGESMRKAFDTMKNDVSRMGVGSRVYSRLHWDRVLHASKIEVHTLREGGVLIRGNVPDLAAKTRAATLAADTVGVTEVIDELVPIATSTSVGTAKRASNTISVK